MRLKIGLMSAAVAAALGLAGLSAARGGNAPFKSGWPVSCATNSASAAFSGTVALGTRSNGEWVLEHFSSKPDVATTLILR